ncbi:hypothetical protein AcW1_005838 [Taiwanofungus camphoratus]|nr:hypothetical protein AcW1_005838 [Antrodia cinnamomea]
MSQSVEALVEDRLMQLQEISRRRNELLKEMYNLLRRRDDLGPVLNVDESSEESIEVFIERFDLEKHPDTGSITNFSDDDLFGLAAIFGEGGSAGEEPSRIAVDNITPESPMSEPPASPAATAEAMKGPKCPDQNVHENEAMNVDEGIPDAPVNISRSSVSVDEEAGSDDVLILESQPQRGARRKARSTTRRRSDVSGDEHDELDLIGSPSTPPPSRFSPTSRMCSVTLDASRAHSAVPLKSQSPAHVPTVLYDEPVERETAATMQDNLREDPAVDSAEDEITILETSEDTVANLLRPSSPTMSALLFVPTEPRRPVQYSIPTPRPSVPVNFNFDVNLGPQDESMATDSGKAFPPDDFLHFKPEYTLPPLSLLPAEFNRKGKSGRHQRRREKEKEKNDKERGDKKSDEWTPMGINKWGAVLRANPVWKKLSKATKCLSTRDWNVAITEIRLIRTLDRIETLKENGGWSYRQPKKQRGVGGLMKTHWDHLMDEMKWMRIDFREERRWKIALAFNLAHAVIDWHNAGTLEERVRRGICVLWKRPRLEDLEDDEGIDSHDEDANVELPDTEEDQRIDSGETNTPINDYGSDDDSDEEQDKEQHDVFDVLAPGAMLEETMNRPEGHVHDGSERLGFDSEHVEPKVEDIEDLSALRNTDDGENHSAMEVDTEATVKANTRDDEETLLKRDDTGAGSAQGLKSDSKDPVLGKHVLESENAQPTVKHKSKSNIYAPLREQIIYSDIDKLFLDFDDLDIIKGMSELSTEDPSFSALPAPTDLSAIFPDLQPLGLLDVPVTSSSVGTENRKKSEKRADKDDPNKRQEDTTYSKLVPMSDFMHCKPSLLGALQPSKHWKNGQWHVVEESTVVADFERTSVRTVEENLCSLFEGIKPNSPSGNAPLLPGPPKDGRRRTVDHVWTSNEDVLLKQLAEKYPNNWLLIADAFNSSRVTISTDKRSARDCFDRWNARWGNRPVSTCDATEDDALPSTLSTPTQMTTRGYKRSANTNVALANINNVSASAGPPSEPRKRRRHNLMYDAIRKSIRKKETAQKSTRACLSSL